MVITRSMREQDTTQNNNTNNTEFQDAQSTPFSNITPSTSTQIHNPTQMSVKLPQFWSSCPETWFIQTELTFNFKGIIDDTTKYQLVVISLSEDVLGKLIDVIHNPPLENKYEYIKKVMLERFSMSEDLRFEKLLNESEIGDRKPSEFFHDLKKLAINNSMVNNDLLTKLWMRKLPPAIQMHLTASNLTCVTDKLTLADKMHELLNKNQVASVSSTISSLSSDLFDNMIKITSSLAENIEKLSLEVSEIRNHPTNKNRNKRNYRNRNFCWYHQKFGIKASKCISPCDFVVNNNRNLN